MVGYQPNENLPPTTTIQDDLRLANRRQLNRVWEMTQASIAVIVTFATLYAAVFVPTVDKAQFTFLTNVLFVVIGFYFGRTNHTRPDGHHSG